MSTPSLDDISVLLDAVRAGGVRALARQRNVPRSTVSRALTRLERALGVSLVERTQGRLRLTEAGEAAFDRLCASLDDARGALAELSASGREVRGLLRITTTPVLSATVLPELVATYLAKHPDVRVEVLSTSERLDLESARVDVALRSGRPEDSERFTARPWGRIRLGFFASPAYLEQRGRIDDLEALLEKDLLVTRRSRATWAVGAGQKVETLRVSGRVHADEPEFLRRMCELGAGVAHLAVGHAQPAVAAGHLVPVLERHWFTADLHLAYRTRPVARVRAFLQVCAERQPVVERTGRR